MRPADPPLSVAGLWRDTKRVAARDWALLAPIAAAFVLLPQLAGSLLVGDFDPRQPSLAAALVTIVTALVAVVAQVAMTIVVLDGENLRGRPVRDVLAEAVRASPRVIGATLLIVTGFGLVVGAIGLVAALATPGAGQGGRPSPALLGVGFLAFLVAAIWVLPRAVALAPAIIEERLGVVGGLRRAFALVRARTGRVRAFALLLLLFVVVALMLVSLVLAAVGAVLQLAGGQELAKLVATLGSTTVGAVASIYLTVAYAVVYRHLRLTEVSGPGGERG